MEKIKLVALDLDGTLFDDQGNIPGENDAEMLAVAGVGVALANAKEKTKKCADYICPWTNNQNAVARVLKQFDGR